MGMICSPTSLCPWDFTVPFLFQSLTSIQCTIPPLNRYFAPLIVLCVKCPIPFNNMKLYPSMQARSGISLPGPHLPAVESERKCISRLST